MTRSKNAFANSCRAKCVDALIRLGQMTAWELSRELELPVDRVINALNTMSRPTTKLPKRVYVIDWSRDDEEARYQLRPVFAAGDLPNKRKPKAFTNSEICKRWVDKHTSQVRAISVFHKGLSIAKCIKQKRFV